MVLRNGRNRKQISIDTLILYLDLHPDLHEDVRSKLEASYGNHFVSGRSGDFQLGLEVQINQVKILPEATSAVDTALSMKLIEPCQGTASFHDIGMRSAVSYLANLGHPEGPRIIKKSRRPYDGYGLNRLLNLIVSDAEFQQSYAQMTSRQQASDGLRAPNLEMVLKGIKSGKFRYGSDGIGFNFKAVYDRYLEDWLKPIIQEPQSAWRTAGGGWTDNLTSAVFFGGGAAVARPIIERAHEKGNYFFQLLEPEILNCLSPIQAANVYGGIISQEGETVYGIDPGSGDIKCARRGASGFVEAAIFPSMFGSLNQPELDNDEIGTDGVVLYYEDGPGARNEFWTMFGAETPNVCVGATQRILDDSKVRQIVPATFAGILRLHLEAAMRGFEDESTPSNGKTAKAIDPDVLEQEAAVSTVTLPNLPTGRTRGRGKAKATAGDN